MTAPDWVSGDLTGLFFPSHSDALRGAGEDFLTEAFRAAGALPMDNRVARITRFEECPGGGTGRKLFLSVAYEKSDTRLHSNLFVKFSRDFDDEIRDRSRHMMDSEVRLAMLSRDPHFPIAVPKCYFADFQRETGTGILVTQCIPFGVNGIERQYPKCLDYEMPEPLAHYEALVKALARLAGTHKAGRLSDSVDRQFPFDADKALENDRIAYDAKRLKNRVARYADFAAAFPQLLPQNIVSEKFIEDFRDGVARFSEHEHAIKRFLSSEPDFIALCHWNANVDNAWFWPDAEGGLECGLLDWGRVGQMNVALSFYGAFSGADIELWDGHLEALLALFAREFRNCGGPVLDIGELKLHVQLATATMGLAYLMDAPPIIKMEIPDLADARDAHDPRFKANENARVQLHMMTMFLNQWQTQDFNAVLDRFLRERAQGGAR